MALERGNSRSLYSTLAETLADEENDKAGGDEDLVESSEEKRNCLVDLALLAAFKEEMMRTEVK